MRKSLLLVPTLLVGLSTVASAQTQIPVSPFSSTYSYASHTRGFNFQAPVDFIITSVQVPDETKHGQQNVAIINMGSAGPSGTVTANELKFYKSAVSSAAPIPCQVQIKKGDWVVILGACGDSTTMHNSYGAGGFSSNVLGQPVTLNRAVHQFNLVSSGGLGAISDGGSGSIARIFVTVTPPTGLFPEFDADKTAGAGPFTVKFTDQTFTSDPGGVTSWAWDFDNDNTVDSTAQNPTHVYQSVNKTAKYSVKLTVTDKANPGGKSITKTDYITVDPPPTADFSATPRQGATTTGKPPVIVKFTDLSIGATTWAWDFNNDNTVDSTAQNPTFPYTQPGKYTVKLAVTGVGGKDDVTKTDYIVVRSSPSLATILQGGNGLSGATNCFMDITVKNPKGVWITGFDTNPYTATTPFDLQIYTCKTSYVGNEQTPAAWTLRGTGSATSVARDQLVSVDTGDFWLAPGTYGLAIHNTAAGHSYTNGDGNNQAYSNADIALALGASGSGLFSGSPITPRVWNGVIEYVTPGWSALGVFGAGCSGSNGTPSLTPSTGSQASVGTTIKWDLASLPTTAGGMIMVYGFSKEKFLNVVPLPLDLTGFGAPGCELLVDYVLTFPSAHGGGTGSFSLPIPNDPNFVGLYMAGQAMVLDSAANALNLSFTNGSELILGG